MRLFVWLLIGFFVARILWSVLTSRSRFRKKATVLSDYIRKPGYVLLNPSTSELADATLAEIVKSVPEGGWVRGSAGITDIEPFKDGSDNPALAFVCQLRGKVCRASPSAGTRRSRRSRTSWTSWPASRT